MLVPTSQEAYVVHELALMESVVDAVIEQGDRLGGSRIAVVRLEIGTLAGVAIDALRFGFEVCTRDTPLDGATLDIVEVPARARCHVCGTDEPMRSFADPCSCGSFDRELLQGDEMRLKELEVV